MGIEVNNVVSFHYRLSEPGGEPFEDSHDEEAMVYLHGQGDMLPGLEQALAGREAGEVFSVTLPPEQAYGERQEGATTRVPIKYLLTKKNLKPGMVVAIGTEQGPRDAVIVKVGRFNVDVDTNHPLAGKTLEFDIEIIAVRDATEEELQHGHAHGPEKG